MKNLCLTLVLFFGLWTGAWAQTQVIKGTVVDKQSEMPLIGAAIVLVGDDSKGAVTDIDGNFRLEGVPIGRQAVQITYLGYNSLTQPNIVVTAGKEVILDIRLEESFEQLNEVVVTAETQKDKAQNEMATISARQFSVEEVNRYSGGRSDVARLASNFAGVANSNDSRNDIVIRGNSPTGVLWRIEGIPIPNPNHFSTLGTTGGPVSAVNPNVLKNSDFLTGAFPSEYGDALAGVFDLGFRSGNRDRHEFMLQLGAVSGLEAMAEGPLNKKNNGSYLVSARYSFVGFASELGLPIGTSAAPNYSDISFKVDFGNTPIGKFTLFGIGGLSDIEFLGSDIDEDDLFAAEDEDSFADSQFGVIGLKHNVILDENTYLRTILSASTSGNAFNVDRYFDLGTPDEDKRRIFEADNSVSRFSLSSFVNKKFSARLTARAGILVENYQYDVLNRDRENTPDLDDDGINDWFTVYEFNNGTSLLQAYAQAQYRITKKWTLNAGLHTQFLTLNDSYALEPRLAVNYNLTPNQTINLGYGLHHQQQPLPILLLQERQADGTFLESNKDLDFTRSNHFVLGYDVKFGGDWRAKLETYYQYIDQVPIEPTPSSFSLLNIGDDFGFPDDRFNLQNEGTGYNVGVELTVEKFFSKGYYGLLTVSVFDSKYEGSDGIERNTAFNNQYVANLLFGREWKIGKSKRHVFSIDTKVTNAGGRYFTPIDLEASQAAGVEVEFEDQAFSEQFDPYFRWDLKFGFRFNSAKSKLSHQFYFDIQNVTNNENVFVRRYNRLTNEVNEVNQIGFFPDFMYRVQF